MGIRGEAIINFDADSGKVSNAGQAASRFVSDVRNGSRTGFTEAERGAACAWSFWNQLRLTGATFCHRLSSRGKYSLG